MADYTINFAAQITANPYVLGAPLLWLGGGSNGSGGGSASNAFQIVNGSGIKFGVYSAMNAVAWAVHNVTFGNLITSEITIPAAVFSGDVVAPGIFIRSGTGVGAGYVARVDGSSMYIDSIDASGVVTQLSSTGGVTAAASDVFKLTFNQTTGDLNAYQNGTLKVTALADNTYTSPQRALMGAGWYMEWGNSGSQYTSVFASTGVNSSATGSGAATEGAGDTASATGATTVGGSGATTEGGADTVAATGAVSTPTIVDVATLTAVATVDGTEILACEVAGPLAKKLTVAQIKAYLADAYATLTADYALTNSTALQKAFNHSANGALTLPVGTYHFETFLYLTGMSATTGNLSFDLLGAGGAVLASVGYSAIGSDSSTPLAAAAISGSASVTAGSVAPILPTAVGTGITLYVVGTFRVTTAGTIIPSLALTTASAASVKAGSFIKVKPLGTTNFGGAWA